LGYIGGAKIPGTSIANCCANSTKPRTNTTTPDEHRKPRTDTTTQDEHGNTDKLLNPGQTPQSRRRSNDDVPLRTSDDRSTLKGHPQGQVTTAATAKSPATTDKSANVRTARYYRYTGLPQYASETIRTAIRLHMQRYIANMFLEIIIITGCRLCYNER